MPAIMAPGPARPKAPSEAKPPSTACFVLTKPSERSSQTAYREYARPEAALMIPVFGPNGATCDMTDSVLSGDDIALVMTGTAKARASAKP